MGGLGWLSNCHDVWLVELEYTLVFAHGLVVAAATQRARKPEERG